MEINNPNPYARKFPRATIDLFVNKVVNDELHTARLYDLSAGGAFLCSLLEPESDATDVGLEMLLPGTDEVVWAAGRVVRSGYRNGMLGVAIEFTHISTMHQALIERFVRRVRLDRENGVVTSVQA